VAAHLHDQIALLNLQMPAIREFGRGADTKGWKYWPNACRRSGRIGPCQVTAKTIPLGATNSRMDVPEEA